MRQEPSREELDRDLESLVDQDYEPDWDWDTERELTREDKTKGETK